MELMLLQSSQKTWEMQVENTELRSKEQIEGLKKAMKEVEVQQLANAVTHRDGIIDQTRLKLQTHDVKMILDAKYGLEKPEDLSRRIRLSFPSLQSGTKTPQLPVRIPTLSAVNVSIENKGNNNPLAQSQSLPNLKPNPQSQKSKPFLSIFGSTKKRSSKIPASDTERVDKQPKYNGNWPKPRYTH